MAPKTAEAGQVREAGCAHGAAGVLPGARGAGAKRACSRPTVRGRSRDRVAVHLRLRDRHRPGAVRGSRQRRDATPGHPQNGARLDHRVRGRPHRHRHPDRPRDLPGGLGRAEGAEACGASASPCKSRGRVVNGERVCTICGEVLAEFGVFVRTRSGFRHGACPPEPPGPAPLAMAKPKPRPAPAPPPPAPGPIAPAENSDGSAPVPPPPSPPPIVSCQPPSDNEDLSLYVAALAGPDEPVRAVARAPGAGRGTPPVKPPAAAPAAPLPATASIGGPDELCIRCSRPLSESWSIRRTAFGSHHRMCPRLPAPAPAAPPPPARRRAPPAPAAEVRIEVIDDEADDTRERCVRCGRGLGRVGYWIGSASGRRHSVCPTRGPRYDDNGERKAGGR
jgi:hypothetical protein